jgi:hypothetical protein
MWMVTSYHAGLYGMCFSLLLLLLALFVPVTMYGSWAARAVHVQMELATMANANKGIARSQLLSNGGTPVPWPTWNLANWGSSPAGAAN